MLKIAPILKRFLRTEASVRGRTGSGRVALASAILLPVASALLTVHLHFLQTTPFALFFLSIAFVANLEGIAYALLAVVLCAVSRALFMPAQMPLHPPERIGYLFLLACALAISLMNKSRRRYAEELESAHSALQERTSVLEDRTEALIQSLHSSKCAAWVIDIESGKGVRWYSGSYPIFGRPFSEFSGLDSLIMLAAPEDQSRLPLLTRAMRTSWEPIVFEHRVLWPDGESHWLEVRGTRVPGEVCVWRGVTVDITDRKQAEAALLRAEKLAAMGRLASTIAHEINNPLEAVTNLLFLARADPTVTIQTGTYLATAERELARLGNITRLALGFVRSGATRVEVEIADVAEDVLSIFRHRFEMKNILLEQRYDRGLLIRIVPHELRQILTNLIANAADATAGTEARIRIRIQRSSRSAFAAILIEDNGTGIAALNLSRIFEPFFTTKEDVGTGIGLWVTRELVEKNDGTISTESGDLADGMKTRFVVEFPLADLSQSTLPAVS